ncbi:MAG: hypothetical protein KDB37_02005 [Ilumatobacter sp.]|nr:hypothetical protein [Ilumatobacter sp.]
MSDDIPESPDEFDRIARAAGEALRRPAPADGVAGVRSVRRRQQIVRGAAGGVAVVLLATIGTVVLTRDGDDERVATVPESTAVTSNVPTPASTTPATTNAPTPSPPSTDPVDTTAPTTTTTIETTVPTTTTATPGTTLGAWGDEQRAAGRTTVERLDVAGGDGSVYVARRLGADDVAGAVLLPDGRVFEMPADALPTSFQNLSAFRLGDRIAVVALSWGDDSPPSMSSLDPTSLTWEAGPDLGFDATGGTDQAWFVDGSVLIGRGTWTLVDDVAVVGTDRRAVIVRPDLSVVEVATPPDGVQTTWSSVSGHRAFSFGYAGVGSAYSYAPFVQPWSLDVRTNAWSPVPVPDWFTCGDAASCEWRQPVEGGVPALEVGTDRGVVTLVPDGSIGLYDPDAGSWRRIDDPPFEPTLPTTAVIGDLVVVAPSLGGPNSPAAGTFAVLDLVLGTWQTGAAPLAADDPGFWSLRSDDDGVLLTRPSSSWPDAAIDDQHDVVVDATTPGGRLVTNDEASRWVPLAPWFDLTVDELG